MGRVEIRVADLTPDSDDTRSCIDLFYEASNDLHERHGYPTEDPGEGPWLSEALAHLGETDPQRTVIASEAGADIAFATAYVRGGLWFLSFLFVRPAAQGQGVGRRLVERLLPREWGGMELATMVESFQPASTMLYASFGIAPRVPRYPFKGVKRLDVFPPLPDGVRCAEADGSHEEAVGKLDRELLGYARPQDHAMWRRGSQAARMYLGEADELLGYGYLGSDGFVSPVAARSEVLTAAILGDLLSVLVDPMSAVTAIAGSSAVLLEIALQAGMRVTGPDDYPLIYCSTGRVPPPGYIAYAGYLI